MVRKSINNCHFTLFYKNVSFNKAKLNENQGSQIISLFICKLNIGLCVVIQQRCHRQDRYM